MDMPYFFFWKYIIIIIIIIIIVLSFTLSREVSWIPTTQITAISYAGDLAVILCTIWYHLYNLKNVKNTHWWVTILVKLQALNFSAFQVF